MNNNGLVFFLRFPEEGKVKTRLAESIGNKHATELYRCFIEDMAETIKNIDTEIIINFTPKEKEEEMRQLIGCNFLLLPQIGYDLGRKMMNAFYDAFKMGYEKVILIGSDIPDIDEEIIETAFEKLNSHNVILGPCFDGGYYLIGFDRDSFHYDIFDEIKWGSDSVLQHTIEIIKEDGLEVVLLPELNDIDDFEDLKTFYSSGCKTKSKTYKYIKTEGIIK